MSEDELAESIQWEAEQYIPFDIEDVNLDYEVSGAGRREHGRPARRGQEGQDQRLHLGRSARPGKTRQVVDVDAFAMQSATRSTTGSTPDEVVALREHRRRIMNINIVKNGTSIFNRDIASAATSTRRRSRRS